ncbi:hypothetical protein AJ80_02920 [Polytolypa hystricis UAMH7299]|uniref:Uncharacterized protein n=1 Tax=Polytolypa hystricis (strain UAMH7299) TaxID=1447883 RepID=A0A2B7YNX5_POLH7|nr:hypothetical protein AJ80_02920 [Polytolypa hystricis UAMH7299]
MFHHILLTLLSFSPTVLGAQPSAPEPIPAPLRNLTWGQLNFLHTTDTHGWLAGHLREASYSADWGDYVSFAARMREKAEADGTDLLLVDTGDRIEGNGLYDSSDPKGLYTADIFKQQHIDVLSSGNHELYKQNSSEDEYLITVPNFKGNYLASNIDIYDPQTGDLVPLAPRYKKFTTKVQGIRIVAFGFLFNFNGNENNTVVQPVEETIQEEWFQEAIREKGVDLFLVVGHVAAQSKEYSAIFKAIREVQWDTPIQFFGGHYHIRDYVKYDSKAYGLASGRFMETIGFMSISGLSTDKKEGSKERKSAGPSFNRKYIDNNLFSFYHHTGLNESTFPTSEGTETSKMITKARHKLNLDRVYGCVPADLWMSRAKYTDKNSIYKWLQEKVIPETLFDESRSSKSAAMVITNTGAIRFDMFKGPFTQDSAYIVSPFTSGFRYTKDVPYDKATKILEVLNKQAQIVADDIPIKGHSAPFLSSPEQQGKKETLPSFANHKFPSDMMGQIPLSDTEPEDPKLIPGYTTTDDAGSDGDDTIHSPIDFYHVPNCIDAFIPLRETKSAVMEDPEEPPRPETVDLVYVDFIEPWINVAAKFVGLDFDVHKDTEVYMPGATLGTLMIEWVEKNWKCD